MHSPAHSLSPAGQVPPQLVPSQVAVPPVGVGQAVHELPQVATAVFEAQADAQVCVPVGQVKPQLVPLQVAVLPVGAAQAVHEVPQVATAVLATQAVPHRW